MQSVSVKAGRGKMVAGSYRMSRRTEATDERWVVWSLCTERRDDVFMTPSAGSSYWNPEKPYKLQRYIYSVT